MTSVLAQRLIEPELLDSLPANSARAIASRRDLVRVNAVMFQGVIMARLLRAHLQRKPLRVLEIGAGDGSFMLSVARRLARQWNDVDLVMLDQADVMNPARRAQFAALGWRVQTVTSNVFDWIDRPEIGAFDLVTANLFLHHFHHRRRHRHGAAIGLDTGKLSRTVRALGQCGEGCGGQSLFQSLASPICDQDTIGVDPLGARDLSAQRRPDARSGPPLSD